jgi:hypothetical protein
MTNSPNWFSEKMKTKVTHIRQARGKRLAGTTRRGDVNEAKVIFPIAGRGEAYELTGAIQDVKPMNPNRDKVSVDMRDYEASSWIYTPDLSKLGPSETQTRAEELAFAINRKEDMIQWDATALFASSVTAVKKVGGATQATTPQFFIANKAGIRGQGDNGQYNIFCPVPEMAMEQLMLYKQFSNSQWVGPEDLPMNQMSDMQVKNHRGIIYFTLPDEYFVNASGVSIKDGATDYFTYMWASDAIGVETNWDEMAPDFNRIHEKEGSPWLGKVGMGGAAVGILPEGVRRLQLKTIAEADLALPA